MTQPDLWLCVSKVPLLICTARGKGDQLASVEFGELVTFTPFPKRSVAAADLLAHGFLRCRKVVKDGTEISQQGWISCNSGHEAHFILCGEQLEQIPVDSGRPSICTRPSGLRSPAQNEWLNALRRLPMPAEGDLKDLSEFRMLLGAKLHGKFRGIVVCDATAGYGMAARPCIDKVAQQWLSDTFAEDVDVVSSLELAGLLEKRSIEDRHRLVLLLVQEPHAWVARAQLGGFFGVFLARQTRSGEDLEFAGLEEASKRANWLRGPVECAGNVHSQGLMSLWSWFVQDLTRAAAAPKYRHVVLCRAEDLLFNAPKLAESLSHLALRRRDGAQEVAPAARTTWWRQAIEPYRQTLGFTMEEAAVIDTPIAGLRGALGYDGSADWLRWANLAEQQMSSLRKDVEGGLVPVDPVDPVDGHDLRVVPQDGHLCRLDELCKKFNTSLSRFDAEQYFWSHCWPRKDTAAAASSFAFDGRWNISSGSLQVTGGAVHWQSGLVTPINATSDLVFDMALDGEVFQGRLEDAGKRLVFSDGDVWTRQTPIQEHPPHDAGATTCQSTRPEQKVEVPEVEVEEDVQPMELDDKDVMSQEPPGGDQIVAAVSEVLFKAVAKADVETVRLGLQQVGLLGHEAVQSLLSIRDEGDSLLHLAAAGSRQSSDASSYVQIANTLLVARANVNDCNRSGATPWRLARKSDPVMEKLLLAFGADPDIGGDKSEVTLVKPFKAQLAQPGQSPEKVGTSEASTRPTRSSSLGSLALPEQRTDEESVEDHNPCQMPEEPPPGAKTTDWPLDLLRGECRSHKLPVSQGCTEAQLVERLAETMLTPGTKKGSLLAGVYIVDACLLPAGPFSAAALVSQGAQVLKIQPDSAGEATCEEATQLVQMQKCGDWQLLPQPLALDLRFAQNQRALDEILTKSQCLIHSFRANTAERVGLGKALKQRHPQLLVISISGQAKSAGSLFAYDAVVTQGSTMTQSSAVQHITPDVAAKMILQSLQNTENAGRHVRVSVMSASF